MKGLVHLLIAKSDFRGTIPPHTLIISPNTSNQSLKIGILFSVVKRSKNYVFDDDIPPAIRARVVSYALGAYVFIERVVA